MPGFPFRRAEAFPLPRSQKEEKNKAKGVSVRHIPVETRRQQRQDALTSGSVTVHDSTYTWGRENCVAVPATDQET